jgi:hypothetical protein
VSALQRGYDDPYQYGRGTVTYHEKAKSVFRPGKTRNKWAGPPQAKTDVAISRDKQGNAVLEYPNSPSALSVARGVLDRTYINMRPKRALADRPRHAAARRRLALAQGKETNDE